MSTATTTYTFSAGNTALAAEPNTNFADLVAFLNANAIQKDGSTSMTQALDLSGAPSSSLHAATKNYVDSAGLGVRGISTATQFQSLITAETDLTGLSVTFTSGSSRRVRLSTWVLVNQVSAASTPVLRIKEGSTTLLQVNRAMGVLEPGFLTGSVVITPTAATHTYKLTLATGAGTVGTVAGPTTPAILLAEDVGSAP